MNTKNVLKKKQVLVGPVVIGGGAPVSVQSMCTTDTCDVKRTLEEIDRLDEAGCDIVRVAVPSAEAAQALRRICFKSPIPVVADIHFDYRLAISSIRAGADKIRINPGNMRDKNGLVKIAKEARKACVPIRVGVNAGSLDRVLVDEYGGVTPEALAASAVLAVRELERLDFTDIVVSAKASSPRMMIETYRLLSDVLDYPLHLGVTEAGTKSEGVIRSAVGIGTLLAEGIGDTIRVSLTADPVEEVRAGFAILKALDLRQRGATLISCPTCGRTEVPLMEIAEEMERRLASIHEPIKVAVMGCVVNGPGEAREADVGIAGGKDHFVLFRQGEVVRKISKEEAVDELSHEIDRLLSERRGLLEPT
ncbi:MAG TPA: flavodoxin-dependent (E)-4-hydroxy-3-methylbut-2-enyl-diphosphate synthase [Clostridiaceae bacterium]|nr:flavodoxin-dependent (E)-4-hydroxy-3-methylbut-2-enyl-diphosphate synthase [Clostridiaceae bacterium]